MRATTEQIRKLVWIFCFFLGVPFLHQAQATYQVKGIRMDSIGKTIEKDKEALETEDEKVAENALVAIIGKERCTISQNVEYDNASITLALPDQEEDTDLDPFAETG